MLALAVASLLVLPAPPFPGQSEAAPPAWDRKLAKAAAKVAEDWFEARPGSRFEAFDAEVRAELLTRARELPALPPGHLEDAVEILFEAAQDELDLPKRKSGKVTFDTPWGEAWAYLDGAREEGGLLVAMHGGGPGVGDAAEARGNWEVEDLAAACPQAVRLDTDAWNTVHGERFVLSLIDWAKIALGTDPDRVYVAGFSMGGTGSWHLAGRYPDLLAGAIPAHGVIMASPKAQLPSRDDVLEMQHGLLPNVRNLAMYWYTGLADVNCMPGTFLFARDRLLELADQDAGGYTLQEFAAHEGVAHEFPPGEPRAGLEWILEKRRDTFPQTVVWQAATHPFPLRTDEDPLDRLPQHDFYWVHCEEPADAMRVRASREGNTFRFEATGGAGFSILLHPEMVPYGEEVVVEDGSGAELYRGVPAPDWVTLFESFDARLDRRMVFDRRIDL